MGREGEERCLLDGEGEELLVGVGLPRLVARLDLEAVADAIEQQRKLRLNIFGENSGAVLLLDVKRETVGAHLGGVAHGSRQSVDTDRRAETDRHTHRQAGRHTEIDRHRYSE